ncbi:hypothetical protein RLO149_c018780 [Roseobacter litoralis Och 149]|uniref:Uncharacterized protein n=2 Tax=Roseobacter litoralis TaxID=42443 RepID=F7ZJN5_ROSLO|nr:hypothetical protein RLO149_c018780 [Roseobacter litoralis Och 149]
MKLFPPNGALGVLCFAAFLSLSGSALSFGLAYWALKPQTPQNSCSEPTDVVGADAIRVSDPQKRDPLNPLKPDQERLLDRLRDMDHAASSFTIFHIEPIRDMTVHTGHRYESLLKPDDLLGAYCYLHVDGDGGQAMIINIAEMDAHLRLTDLKPDKTVLERLGLSRKERRSLLGLCVWPSVAS